jgi:hypothetical protein
VEEDSADEPVYLTQAQLDQIIADRLAERDADHQRAVEAMQLLIPQNSVPAHAGGSGLEIARSWSLAQQEASLRGDPVE